MARQPSTNESFLCPLEDHVILETLREERDRRRLRLGQDQRVVNTSVVLRDQVHTSLTARLPVARAIGALRAAGAPSEVTEGLVAIYTDLVLGCPRPYTSAVVPGSASDRLRQAVYREEAVERRREAEVLLCADLGRRTREQDIELLRVELCRADLWELSEEMYIDGWKDVKAWVPPDPDTDYGGDIFARIAANTPPE